MTSLPSDFAPPALTQGLELSREGLRAVIDALPDVVTASNASGTMLFISPSVEAMMGYSTDEMMANASALILARTHPDDLLQLQQRLIALGERGEPMDFEYRFQRKDGQWIWVHTRARVTPQNDGPVICSITSDITARKTLEAQMRQAQKLEAIGQLTGGVAHDFNNILTSILVSSNFLMRDLERGSPSWEDADEIRQAGERAAALTRQLLAFSRKQVVQPRELEVNDVIKGVEKMLRRLIGEDIAFKVHLGPSMAPVVADPSQIEQLVMNLVVNARDAMPRGGALTVETSQTPPLGKDGPMSVVTVRDSGTGMDEATLGRIFEPFFTTKGEGRGTGLGLATVQSIVQQLGGRISVWSRPGEGTEFRILLPQTEAAATGAAPAAPAPRVSRTGETVLLIEDEDGPRALLTRLLEREGYKVLPARDALEAEAQSITHKGKVDLVLTDVVLTQGNGIGCIERVRRHSPKARALCMSGYTDHPALLNAAATTSFPFIQKPFAPETLARKVREVLDA